MSGTLSWLLLRWKLNMMLIWFSRHFNDPNIGTNYWWYNFKIWFNVICVPTPYFIKKYLCKIKFLTHELFQNAIWYLFVTSVRWLPQFIISELVDTQYQENDVYLWSINYVMSETHTQICKLDMWINFWMLIILIPYNNRLIE